MQPNPRLRAAREQRGWSQARVADEVGTTSRNVSRWERGISVPQPYFREKLCALFALDTMALGLVPRADLTQRQPISTIYESSMSTQDGQCAQTMVLDPALPLPSAIGLPGRERLWQELAATLAREPGSPLMLAFYGLPGVGKTTVANRFIFSSPFRERFRDGVLWCRGGPHLDIVAQLQQWGNLLNIASPKGALCTDYAFWRDRLRAAIGQRHFLIVIDDVWDAETALALKIGGPNCTYIITTRCMREALRITDALPIAVPELDSEGGMALFRTCIPRLVDEEPEACERLIQAVGGLPLALTLMGNYLRVEMASEQPRRWYTALERLKQSEFRLHLSMPSGYQNRRLADTSRSLYSAIALSDQQLDERTRAAWYALSVFPAKPAIFSEEAALTVCAQSVEVLDTLCDVGLLMSAGPGFYMLHPTIADYVRWQQRARNQREVHGPPADSALVVARSVESSIFAPDANYAATSRREL